MHLGWNWDWNSGVPQSLSNTHPYRDPIWEWHCKGPHINRYGPYFLDAGYTVNYQMLKLDQFKLGCVKKSNFSTQFFLFFLSYAVMQVVLSKFVRQMGDLLPSTLYISYLRMLKGLANGPQCAHYCFSLLKTNGATHSKSRLLL